MERFSFYDDLIRLLINSEHFALIDSQTKTNLYSIYIYDCMSNLILDDIYELSPIQDMTYEKSVEFLSVILSTLNILIDNKEFFSV